MTLFYCYDEKGYYTGEPVEAEKQPSRSSEWAPNIQEGFTPYFDGIGWVQIPKISDETPLEMLKDRLYADLDAVKYLRDPKYTREEVASWPEQKEEANQYFKDGTVGLYLKALSAAVGEDPETLALKILEKVEAHAAQRAELVAKIVKIRTQISSATSSTELPDPADIQNLRNSIRTLTTTP